MTQIPATDMGEKTYYAKWVGEICTVALDLQGGTGCAETISYRYGETVALPKNLTKEGNVAFKIGVDSRLRHSGMTEKVV